MKKSNDSIENALFLLGKTYQDGIQDYQYAINAYDTLLTKFPATAQQEQPFSIYITATLNSAIRQTPTECWNC